jgi:hypothetical protein
MRISKIPKTIIKIHTSPNGTCRAGDTSQLPKKNAENNVTVTNCPTMENGIALLTPTLLIALNSK